MHEEIELIDDLIPTFNQVPYHELIQRVDKGTQSISELLNLFNDRKEVQEKLILYLIKVSRSKMYENEIETSTSERLLGFFKNYHLFQSKAESKVLKELSDNLAHHLEELKHSRTIFINNMKNQIQTIVKDVTVAQDAVIKAKKHHAKTKQDYQRSVEKLSNLEIAAKEYLKLQEEKKRESLNNKDNNKFSVGRMFSAFETTPDQDRDKQIRKVEKRRNEMIQASNLILEKRKFLLELLYTADNAFDLASKSFQDIEIGRMKQLKEILKYFCVLERSALDMKREQLMSLEEAINLHKPEEDIALFISQYKRPELTHKYGNALSILNDFNYQSNEQLNETEFEKQDLVEKEAIIDEINEKLKALDEDPIVLNEPENQVEGGQGTELNSENPILSDEPESKIVEIMNQIFLNLQSAHLKALVELTVEDWKILLDSKSERERFLQELDHHRSHRAEISLIGYDSLVMAMEVILDFCDSTEDVISAIRIANMANTFHKIGSHADSPDITNVHKTYIQSENNIKSHPIWRRQGFWDSVIKESVFSHMSKSSEIVWDELVGEPLREVVQNIHNVVFGQLGTLSLTMIELGLSKEEVVRQIISLSRKFQLTEDQEFDLIINITGQKVKEYVPPPIIPTVGIVGTIGLVEPKIEINQETTSSTNPNPIQNTQSPILVGIVKETSPAVRTSIDQVPMDVKIASNPQSIQVNGSETSTLPFIDNKETKELAKQVNDQPTVVEKHSIDSLTSDRTNSIEKHDPKERPPSTSTKSFQSIFGFSKSSSSNNNNSKLSTSFSQRSNSRRPVNSINNEDDFAVL